MFRRKSVLRLWIGIAICACFISLAVRYAKIDAVALSTNDGFTFEVTSEKPNANFARITEAPGGAGTDVNFPEFVQSGATRYYVTEIVVKSGSFNSFDVTQCKALQYLDCSGLGLKSLILGNNEALEYLYCHDNKLASLTLSGLQRLIWLDCSNNALTELNTNDNPRLSWLKAERNSITTLSFTENTELEKAEVKYNKLTSVTITSLKKLRKLDVRYNCLLQGGVEGLDSAMSERLAKHFDFYCTAAIGVYNDNCRALHGYYVDPQYPNLAEFFDVSSSDWFAPYIEYASQNGIMRGIGDNKFNPNGILTRAQLVTILYRVAGSPKVSGTASPFSDVPADAYYLTYVNWAVSNKIVNGYGDGVFGPDDPVTREQFALILFNFAKTKGADTSARIDLPMFDDYDKISSWAGTAVSWCAARGIITGDNTKKFNPGNGATRAEASTMIYRFIENIIK